MAALSSPSSMDRSPTRHRPDRALPVLACLTLLGAVPAWSDADDEWRLARNLYRQMADYATAAQLFADFIRNHPGHANVPDARLLLARSYAGSSRCAEAVPAYDSFVERHSGHLSVAEARRERADCLQQLDRFEEAAEAFEEVQRLYRESGFAPGALLQAAGNHLRSGDPANAVRLYDELLSEYGGTREARQGRVQLARVRFAGGDPESAQELLSEVWKAAPASEEARHALLLSGQIHLFLSRTAAGAAAFGRLHQAFPRSAESDSAHLVLASHLMDRGRYDEAVTAYRKAASAIRDPGRRARARVGCADALRVSGRHEEALSLYEPLSQAGATGVDDPLRGRAMLGRAISLGQTGRFALAVHLFLDLVQSPSSGGAPPAHAAAAVRQLGALYRRQGDLPRARSWFLRYLDDAERLGAAFPETEAERDLTRLHLAQVYDASGYHDEAVRLFTALSRDSGPVAADAQHGLADAYDGAGARRLAVAEYRNFLARFPRHPRAPRVRQRLEYLDGYTITDADGLALALQQKWIDELTGVPRRRILLDVARILRDHQDFPGAVRAWGIYAASYPDDPTAAEARFHLADCLYRLARQRQLEGRSAASDSLHALALEEDALLGESGAEEWSRMAQLRRAESIADSAPEDRRQGTLEDGYVAFLERNPLSEDTRETRARALIGLADARLEAAHGDSGRLAQADSVYARLLSEAGDTEWAPQARFGRAVVRLRTGEIEGAVDALSALLPQVSGSGLRPRVLANLGSALARGGRFEDAAMTLSELQAYPDFEGRRESQELLADIHFRLGEPRRAGELLSSLASTDPDGDVDGSLRYRLARAHDLAGDLPTALTLYERLLTEGAGSADTLQLARGRLLARLGRADEALAAYSRVRGPARASADLGAGELHFEAGRYGRAWTLYAPRLGSDEATAGDVGRAVVSLFELGRTKEAKSRAKEHRKRFGDDGVWAYLFRLYEGRGLLKAGKWEAARKHFAEVSDDAARKPAQASWARDPDGLLTRMASDPAGAGAYLAATAEWERMRSEPSEESTAQALKAQSDFAAGYPDSPFSADVHLRLGAFHQTLGNLLPAAGAYRRVLESPRATRAQRQEAAYKLLRCYSRLYQWDEALRVARRIEDEFPRHPDRRDVQLEIGYILKETGQYGAAISYLEEVLEWAKGEDAAEARYYIGQCYQNMSEYRMAIQAFAQVAFHGADASVNWINSADFQRAGCHEQLGEFDQARSIFQRIINREGAGSEYGRAAHERIQGLPEGTPR